jgi:hypothetical protein
MSISQRDLKNRYLCRHPGAFRAAIDCGWYLRAYVAALLHSLIAGLLDRLAR